MRILVFLDDINSPMMYPNGEIATKERILEDFPAARTFKYVIETDENREVCFAVENFSAMKTRYDIDKSLNDSDALQAIQDIINTPEENYGTDSQTRIADALEDLVVLNMPDEEV